jgi:hypothetical protein
VATARNDGESWRIYQSQLVGKTAEMDLYVLHHRWQRLLPPNLLLFLSVCFGIEQAYVGRWMYKGLTDPKQFVGRSSSAENLTSSTIFLRDNASQ